MGARDFTIQQLTQALEEVSALLVLNFPAEPDAVRPNELPDAVVRR